MKQVDTIVLVKDIKKSDAFYRGLFGLEIVHDWETMMVYKNRLALHQLDKLQPESFAKELEAQSASSRIIIYLELDKGIKLEDLLEKLTSQNVTIIHGIYELPWQRILRIADPDNNIIEIGEPSED